MVEYWKVVFKRIKAIFNFIVDTNVKINLSLHYSGTHHSNIPSFQHSNWGEAPHSGRSN